MPHVRSRRLLVANLVAVLAAVTPASVLAQDQEATDTLVDQDPAPDPSQRDDEIRLRLNAVYDRVEGLRGVEADVGAGVVVLTGRTLSFELRAEAARLATSTEGVVFVDNRIVEETAFNVRVAEVAGDLRERAWLGIAYLPLLAAALLILAAFVVVARYAGRWQAPYRMVSDNPFARSLAQQLVQGAILLVGLISALELLNATALVGAVLGTAGVLGIAAGFAFRNIVENHLAGAILSLRRPFALDDVILIGDHEGMVVRLTPRETILMTLEGNHLRIPNATVFNSVILNYTRNPLRQFRFDVSIGTGEDLARVQDLGRAALQSIEGVLDEPGPRALIRELGDSWVLVRYLGWVDQTRNDFAKVRGEAIRVVKEALDAAGVDMPSPEYQIRMDERDTSPVSPSRQVAPPAGGPAPDLSLDPTLDRQIADDRKASPEENLLADDKA